MKRLLQILFILFSYNSLFAQQSQNDLLQNYSDEAYTVYQVNDKAKLEPIAKTWPIQFIKASSNIAKIIVKRSGILDEPFTPDVAAYPAYFFYKNYRLTFLPGYAVYYKWNAKQEVKTKYVFVKANNKLHDDIETINTNVQKYVLATFKNQSSAKANQKTQKAIQDEAERKANSLEGKEVVKIEIQFLDLPTQISHYDHAINYGIIATLKDGSQLKTPNLGGKLPWDDFILEHKGCTNLPEIVHVETDATKIPNDEIVFNITPKQNKQLNISKHISTTNDVEVQVNRNGFRGIDRGGNQVVFQGVDGQHGGDAEKLIIKVASYKHKQTGALLNKIEVYSQSKKEIVAQYKLAPTTALTIYANGGNGMDGRKGYKNSHVGGNGGNGGDGGNITIIKDPSVKDVNINIHNQGGKGGKGGPPANKNDNRGADGNAGNDGTTSRQTQKLTLNF